MARREKEWSRELQAGAKSTPARFFFPEERIGNLLPVLSLGWPCLTGI
jgi:hypothetical protein